MIPTTLIDRICDAIDNFIWKQLGDWGDDRRD